MRTRPRHVPPQTLKQAKATYNKYGPRLSSQEARQIERGAELLRRAEKIKDAEQRRHAALKKRHDKEQREREQRKLIAQPFQKPSGSQSVLDMFVKVQPELPPVEESTISTDEDPWDDEIDDMSLMNIKVGEHRLAVSNEPVVSGQRATNKFSSFKQPAHSLPAKSETKTEDELGFASRRATTPNIDSLLDSISTQDVTLSPTDLKDLGLQARCAQRRDGRTDSKSSSEADDQARYSDGPQLCSSTHPNGKGAPSVPTSFTDFDFSTQERRDLAG